MSGSEAARGSSGNGAPNKVRWSPAGVIFALVAGVAVWFVAESLLANAGRLTHFSAGFGVFLLLYVPWLFLMSPHRGRARWLRLVVLALLVLVCSALFRVEGMTGSIVPILGWRFRGSALTGASDLAREAEASAETDLTTTTPFDYPQFLGANRRASVQSVRILPDWSAHPPRELWRHAIGKGWSSFAIVGPYAVTQEQRGEEELVVCYEVQSGQVRWVHRDPVQYVSVIAGDGPRGTPTISDGRVYTLGATGLLNCLDGASGNPLWQVDLVQDNDAEILHWGISCSPLVVDGLVVVSAGGQGGKSLVAYDAQSGARVWSSGSDRADYASPVVATVAGKRQVLIVNATAVAGHDLATGELLWDYPWGGDYQNIAQPVAIGESSVFVSADFGCALLDIRQDEEGKFDAEERWRNLNMKTKFTNVVLVDDHVIGLDNGILRCIEIDTGQSKWKRGRYGHGQILLVGDSILVQAESGEVVLVEATPEQHRELGRIAAFGDKTWNNPALSGRYLLLRNDREAVCYELAIEELTAGEGS